MVGVWEGLNLGSIPNDHIPSQKVPKISIERKCSKILSLKLRRFYVLQVNPVVQVNSKADHNPSAN